VTAPHARNRGAVRGRHGPVRRALREGSQRAVDGESRSLPARLRAAAPRHRTTRSAWCPRRPGRSPPAAAAPAERIADERRREERLAETFEPLMRLDGRHGGGGHPTIRVLSGLDGSTRPSPRPWPTPRRNSSPSSPTSTATTDRPGSGQVAALAATRPCSTAAAVSAPSTSTPSAIAPRPSRPLRAAARRRRGPHPRRGHRPPHRRRPQVAFIPANKDRTLALEVRHPALIDYFVTTFDRLWHLATPMYPEAVHPLPQRHHPRQRAIAGLLVEGHTDAVIADRLGMNIRTARVHIAKLAATLGSESRAQLGYLIGQSGILDPGPGELRGTSGRRDGPSRPAWAMRTPSWVRLAAPSVSDRRAMWARHVRTLMPSRSAITASWWPSASRAAMDCSRCEMPSMPVSGRGPRRGSPGATAGRRP
jgi:DNA-binding CsgD family transcriptional regulator